MHCILLTTHLFEASLTLKDKKQIQHHASGIAISRMVCNVSNLRMVLYRAKSSILNTFYSYTILDFRFWILDWENSSSAMVVQNEVMQLPAKIS
jgi:hypothetical protein